MFELSQRFYFEAAHTLDRRIETESSRRIHGHTYQSEVTICGTQDPTTGMVMDLGHLRLVIGKVRTLLDHCLLDDVVELGAPTIENLCMYLYNQISSEIPNIISVRIWREASGDSCLFRPKK